jgi:signal transduction histidine kinase
MRWWHPLALAGFWTLVGLAFAGQLYLTQTKLGTPVSWAFAVTRSLADWYVFALLSWPALRLARRFPLGDAPTPWLAALHLVAGFVFSLVWMLLRAGVAVGLEQRPFAETLRHALVATLVFNVLVYWVTIVVAHAFGFYERMRERERRGLELEKRLAESRLQALQMQLNPHFLFNALHGVSALMYRDVDAADRMLVRLSELLRHALDRSEAQRVPLRDELAFLDRYLELEQIRFAGRLKVNREVADATGDALVPNLILQPLVENAIKHGLASMIQPGTITLRAARLPDQRLRLEVEDNGVGLGQGQLGGTGIGLTNCRARLRQLYGDRAQLQLGPGDLGGVRVTLELPFEQADRA